MDHPVAEEEPEGKRPLKEPPESRVEPNMPDRVALAASGAAASAGGGLRGLVPRKSLPPPPCPSLLKTSSPREAITR